MRILKGDEVVATVEQLCLHVDMKAGKTVAASPEVWAKLKAIAEAHAGLPLRGWSRSGGWAKEVSHGFRTD